MKEYLQKQNVPIYDRSPRRGDTRIAQDFQSWDPGVSRAFFSPLLCGPLSAAAQEGRMVAPTALPSHKWLGYFHFVPVGTTG